MIHRGKTTAEIAAMAADLIAAAKAQERYELKARYAAEHVARLLKAFTEAVSGSQDEVSVELVTTVERPRCNDTSTPSL